MRLQFREFLSEELNATTFTIYLVFSPLLSSSEPSESSESLQMLLKFFIDFFFSKNSGAFQFYMFLTCTFKIDKFIVFVLLKHFFHE